MAVQFEDILQRFEMAYLSKVPDKLSSLLRRNDCDNLLSLSLLSNNELEMISTGKTGRNDTQLSLGQQKMLEKLVEFCKEMMGEVEAGKQQARRNNDDASDHRKILSNPPCTENDCGSKVFPQKQVTIEGTFGGTLKTETTPHTEQILNCDKPDVHTNLEVDQILEPRNTILKLFHNFLANLQVNAGTTDDEIQFLKPVICQRVGFCHS